MMRVPSVSGPLRRATWGKERTNAMWLIRMTCTTLEPCLTSVAAHAAAHVRLAEEQGFSCDIFVASLLEDGTTWTISKAADAGGAS